MFRKFLCWIGMHGPNWYGVEHGRCGICFQRVCPFCGERWYGDEVEIGYGTRAVRTVGDFRTEKQLRKNGLWRGK